LELSTAKGIARGIEEVSANRVHHGMHELAADGVGQVSFEGGVFWGSLVRVAEIFRRGDL
jgi:hypothetical protein